VLSAAPTGFFEQSAIDAVRLWRYSPADVARLPKRDKRIKIRIDYVLSDGM
jgi:outer membrane biosynthesis protein TonB